MLIGSSRNAADEGRVKVLQSLVAELGLEVRCPSVRIDRWAHTALGLRRIHCQCFLRCRTQLAGRRLDWNQYNGRRAFRHKRS